MAIKLTESQRQTINLLIGAMLDANNATPYDAVGYDSNQAAFNSFVRAIIGDELFNAIDRTNHAWNWHGNETFADDAQAAIDNAESEVASRVSYMREAMDTLKRFGF